MPEALLKKLKRSARLPSPPGAALQILELCQNDDVDINMLADAIAPDPALSVRLLKYANSAMMAATHEVSTVREAVMRLGLRSVRLMALSFSLISSDDPKACKGFDYELFWGHSLACAVASRTLAKLTRSVPPEEAFAGGLLAHIGKLVFAVGMPDQYPTVLAQAGGTLGHTEAAEEQVLETSHHQLGADLLTEWGIPASLCKAIRHQGRPQEMAEDDERTTHFAAVLNGATQLADLICKAVPPDDVEDRWHDLGNSMFFESPENAQQACEEIMAEYRELSQILELKDASDRSIEDIQAEAGEVLQELSLATQLQSDAVEEANRDLQKKVWTDGLTQIANRAAFDKKLDELWREVIAHRQPIALVMLDIDHFKWFNDTYGHQTGDVVLQGVASCLQPSVRDIDFVARYGGEEFMAILPNTDRVTAAQIAVNMRKAIEANRVEFQGKHHQVTASLGVVIVDEPGPPFTPKKLVEAADQQLYVSKDKGRNCCNMKHFVAREPATAGR